MRFYRSTAVSVDSFQMVSTVKRRHILGFAVPAWKSPIVQVVLTGFVCFLCPGMFNALGGIGAAGQQSSVVQSNANSALYTTFAVVGFFAGSGLNYFGARASLTFGGVGYALYAASFLCYNHTKNALFVYIAGGLLGVCAAFLWTAQGTVMMSYPTEGDKGKYIGVFWAIFNSGAVIGALIPIAQNWTFSEKSNVVTDGTYIGFLSLMVAGSVLASFLVKPEQITRSDGTTVQKICHPSAWTEIYGLWQTLRTDIYIILLFPMFFASNWFYTYQQNCYNLFFFNLRTRAINNLWYWLGQIVGAVIFGCILDLHRLSRRRRAILGWCILFVLVNIVWGGGLKALSLSSREIFDAGQRPEIDIHDKNYIWYLFLYIAYGLMDAMWQTYIYWLMGALSNEPHKLAYFAGFYKGIQSAGAAVVWRLDAVGRSYDLLFGTSWGLCAVGLVLALPVIWIRVQDTDISIIDFPDSAIGPAFPQDYSSYHLPYEFDNKPLTSPSTISTLSMAERLDELQRASIGLAV